MIASIRVTVEGNVTCDGAASSAFKAFARHCGLVARAEVRFPAVKACLTLRGSDREAGEQGTQAKVVLLGTNSSALMKRYGSSQRSCVSSPSDQAAVGTPQEKR